MAEGVPYVIAAYAVSGLVLGAWFAMIAIKLRRQRASEASNAS